MIHLVNILPNADLASVEAALASIGPVTTPHPTTPRLKYVEAEPEAAAQIKAIGGVCNCADINLPGRLDLLDVRLATSQSLNADQWALGYISGPDDLANYHYDADGTGVVVINIDTPGVENADLAGRFQKIYDPHGVPTSNSHGTLTAGCVGGTQNGIAKGVQIRNVAGFDGAGNASAGALNAAYSAALDYVEANPGPRYIITNSWSVSGTNFPFGGPIGNPFTAVIDRGVALGVVQVCSAGNGDSNNNPINLGSTNLGIWPAMDPDMITVGAHNKLSEMAFFSNYGGQVDIFAPGVSNQLMGLSGEAVIASGTSFSSPFVAGMLACAASAGVEDLRQWLIDNALPGKIAGVPAGVTLAAHKPAVLGGVLPPPAPTPSAGAFRHKVNGGTAIDRPSGRTRLWGGSAFSEFSPVNRINGGSASA